MEAKEMDEEKTMNYGARYIGVSFLTLFLVLVFSFIQINLGWIILMVFFFLSLGFLIEWRWIVITLIVSIIFGIVGMINGIPWLPVPILTLLLLVGLFAIDEQYRANIEKFRKFNRSVKPGLRWIFLPGIVERIKERIFIEEQRVPIYPEPITIDFVDGSAGPKNAIAYLKIYKPDEKYALEEGECELLGLTGPEIDREKEERTGVYRATYHIREHYIAGSRTLLANSLRSYLNSLVIDEGLIRGRAGYNLLQPDKDGKERIPRAEVERIYAALKRWGVSLFRTTVEDFDLPSSLVAMRQERHRREKEVEAAPYVAGRRAEETVGARLEMLVRDTGMKRKKIKTELRLRPKKFLKKYGPLMEQHIDLIHRRMGIDGGAYLDIRTVAGEPGKTLLDLAALLKRIPPGKSGGKGVEEGEKSRSEEIYEEIRKRELGKKGKR